MRGLIVLLAATFMVSFAQRKNYEGYNIWDVTVSGQQQASVLQAMEDEGHLEILKLVRNSTTAQVWMGRQGLASIRTVLRATNMRMSIKTHGIPEMITAEFKRLDERYRKDKYAFDLNDFNTYEAMMSQINTWVSSCPSTLECSSNSIGRSYEGRNIMKMTIKKAGSSGKRVIMLEHTIHAREWLSTTTIQKVIDHLINNYGSDSEVTMLLDNFEIVILPIANPDGYVETWTGDRMWRKSRSINIGSRCLGTDLNRNFNAHWAKQGTSWNKCGQTYHGASAASEIETRHIQDEAANLQRSSGNKVIAWFAVHCCIDFWMFPYGFRVDYKDNTPCAKTATHSKLLAVGTAAVNAIGKNWKTGTICDVIYPATGDTGNYMYDVPNVPYTFAIELDGNFIASKLEIQIVYDDFWTGFMASINKIREIEG